jgi:hypothetical protein
MSSVIRCIFMYAHEVSNKYWNTVKPERIPKQWVFRNMAHFKHDTMLEERAYSTEESFFIISFYLQSVPVHSANCVKDVYSGM